MFLLLIILIDVGRLLPFEYMYVYGKNNIEKERKNSNKRRVRFVIGIVRLT